MPAELLLEVPIQTSEELEAEKFLDSHDDHKTGEAPDSHARQILSLAYKAVDKFPELAKKHHVWTAGKWAVSAGLIGFASFTVYKELTAGKHPSKILEDITPQDMIPKKHKFSLNKTPNPRGH